MKRTQLLMSYRPIADFIAQMNGEHCEVLIHDVRDLEHSIIYVTQPSLTNRHRGNGMTEYAVELIRTKRYKKERFVVNYVGGSMERVFRSSTYFIMDGEELAGLMCVNIDISYLMAGIDSLKQALILDPAKLSHQETFYIGSTIDERVDNILQRSLDGRSPKDLCTEEKRQLVQELRRDGVFEFKGKVSEIAQKDKLLAISTKNVSNSKMKLTFA